MTTLDAFRANFSGRELPIELLELLAFQSDESDFESYSSGFGLYADGKSGLHSWSTDPEFLERLMPFAQANGSGSFYALWDTGDGDKLASLPVVVFGDEGGQHVVARNVRELLQLLSYDAEPLVDHDEVSFEELTEDIDAQPDAESYRDWLEEHFGLAALTTADAANALIADAQGEFGAAFKTWLARYVD